MKPLISILIPCYNAERYIENATRSIMNQSYPNLEIIIINDFSTDRSLDIISKLAIEDKRIKIINNDENLKIVKTLNKGIDFCNGEFIARMDADDFSLPLRIEKQVQFMQENPSIDILGTLFNTFTDKNPEKLSLHTNPLLDSELRAYMLFKSGICHPSVMIRKRVFKELDLHFELQYLHVEDFAFWSKALYKTRLANLKEPLLLYRVHENQISTLNNKLQRDNKKKIFAIHMEYLGIDINEENLSMHASVAECVPEVFMSEKYLKNCEAYMLKLITINQTKTFCSKEYLANILSIHWLRLCANSRLGLRTIKVVKTSKLYNKEFYNNKDILILYFKAVFKIKYKESKIYKIFF